MARHQQTKKCSAIREQGTKSSQRMCEYCHKYFAHKQSLAIHAETCIWRFKKLLVDQQQLLDEKDLKLLCLQHEITELQQRIKTTRLETENEILRTNERIKTTRLETENEMLRTNERIKTTRLETENEILRTNEQRSKDVIERIAQQPKTTHTHNNLVLPSIDTSQENVNRMVESNYNMNHFCSGQKGVARFAVDHLLIDENKQLGYVCTDPARTTFKHMGEEGEVVRDVKATRLTTKLSIPIKVKAGKLASELTDMDKGNEELIGTAVRHFQDVSGMVDDNSGFRTELAGLTAQ